MNRKPIAIVITLCACKREETPHAEAIAQSNPIVADSVASPMPSDTPVASASSTAAASASVSIGMLALLAGDGGAPWGREDSLGNDPLSARGNMWGDAIGDSYGAGGLGLTGIGDAGGRGEGIGLGNIGTIGHGSGTGSGGFASARGSLGRQQGRSARIRQGVTTVNGRLPPEVIQRIARQNFGRFRLCYETGLTRDPKLAGTVATKFVIDTKGAVMSTSRDAATTLTDAAVVTCVMSGFSNLSFPAPEGGIVTVIYPLLFDPPDSTSP